MSICVSYSKSSYALDPGGFFPNMSLLHAAIGFVEPISTVPCGSTLRTIATDVPLPNMASQASNFLLWASSKNSSCSAAESWSMTLTTTDSSPTLLEMWASSRNYLSAVESRPTTLTTTDSSPMLLENQLRGVNRRHMKTIT